MIILTKDGNRPGGYRGEILTVERQLSMIPAIDGPSIAVRVRCDPSRRGSEKFVILYMSEEEARLIVRGIADAVAADVVSSEAGS